MAGHPIHPESRNSGYEYGILDGYGGKQSMKIGYYESCLTDLEGNQIEITI